MKNNTILNKRIKKYQTADLVPSEFSTYLYDLNARYSNTNSDHILGRGKVLRAISKSFLKTKYSNVLILGEHGSGKTAVVQKLVSYVIQGKCPNYMKNYHFWYLDVELILAHLSSGTNGAVNQLENMLIYLLNCQNIVIVIENLHLIQNMDLLKYYFSLYLKQPNVKVIGISTNSQIAEFDGCLLSRMQEIVLGEPAHEEMFYTISKAVKRLESSHKVKISDRLVRYAINVSYFRIAFNTTIVNPALTIDIIEDSMILAKIRRNKSVEKKDINRSLNFNYDLYDKTNAETKKVLAYHEAGHFIVSKYVKNIEDMATAAITLIPSYGFRGANVFEFFDGKQVLPCDMEYYIDYMAIYLAGRMAELIYYNGATSINSNTKKIYTEGTENDLKKVTETARDIIIKHGMCDSIGENISLSASGDEVNEFQGLDYEFISEQMKDTIHNSIKKYIKLAENRAKEILNSHIELIKVIADALVEDDILDCEDLKEICKKYESAN